jgi:hypothetical protein
MAGQHHIRLEAGIFDQRQEQELTVPHGDDARMMMGMLVEPDGYIILLARRAADKSNIFCEQRTDCRVDQPGSVLRIRHSVAFLPAVRERDLISHPGCRQLYSQS